MNRKNDSNSTKKIYGHVLSTTSLTVVLLSVLSLVLVVLV